MITYHHILALTFLILMSLNLDAQTGAYKYDKAWKQVEKHQKKGMTRSALEVVDEIYAHAREDGLADQRIKALIHRIKFQQEIAEKSDSLTVAMLKTEIEAAEVPERSLLQMLLADYYWYYYQVHRWQILNRSQVEEQPADFQGWDPKQFHAEISRLYLEALAPKTQLQQIPVRKFEAILLTAKESDVFRPTLYDFIAHHALEYFMNTEAWVTEAANKFELRAEEVMVDIPTFLKLRIESADSLSRELQVLRIFQELLRLHNQKREVQALVDAELKRLKYLRQHALGEQTDSLYAQALARLAVQFRQHPIVAEVKYEIASLYNERAAQYKPLESEDYRWDRKKALEICEEVIEQFPQSRGAQLCRQLQTSILSHSLHVQVENVGVPGQPFRARLDYKNLGKVYCRIIEDQPGFYKPRDRKKVARLMAKAPPLQQWSTSLKDEGDYQQHSTEIKVPALKAGKYLLLVSDHEDFSIDEHALAYTQLQLTHLSYVHRVQGGQLSGYVMHRETGQPLDKVRVQQLFWDYKADDYLPSGTFILTGEDGYFSFPNSRDYRRYALEMSWKGETYRTNTLYGYGYEDRPLTAQQYVHFFTDRKIYRPGQTIYYKAIVLEKRGHNYQILPNRNLKVEFFDVNYQKIAEQELSTNEYGTLHGSFIAPSGGLLGNMTLSAEGGNTSISVEEYKRPKFEVVINPVEGKYALGEEVKVSGQAKSYAGANIDGARLRYRVLREARFPYWYRWWLPMPQSPAREIASGDGITDENGRFSISFTAIPDEKIEPDSKPIFTYRVEVDVVDITGETHSGRTAIRAGYVSLEVEAQLAEKIDRQQPDSLRISSKNLNGQFEPVQGSFTIAALNMPDHVFRSRRWAQVDSHVLSEAEYRKAFPYDVYAREDDPRFWDTREVVLSGNFDTGTASSLSLGALKNQQPGWYKLELHTADGEIELVKFFQLTDSKAKRTRVPEVLQVFVDKTRAEPGEEVTLSIGSFERKVWVLYELEQDGKLLDHRWVYLRKNNTHISLPITEAQRGNVTVSLSLIRHNEFKEFSQTIVVPWTNKQLQLEWMSFRSELLPGQQEQWKLKIAGPKGEQVAAELVATLYDASLDAFRPNSFAFNIYPSFSRQLNWNHYDGFGVGTSSLIAEKWNPRAVSPPARTYDRLNWFGVVNAFGGIPRRGAVQLMAASAPMAEKVRAKPAADPAEAMQLEEMVVSEADSFGAEDEAMEAGMEAEEAPAEPLAGVPVRSNLNETAFFFPQLETNEAGEIILNFTMPEALTRWKFLGFAHTKNLEIGQISGETLTQKDLMVVPNAPRFFREGDSMLFTAKVVNLSEAELSGVAALKLLDAFSMQPVEARFELGQAQQKFVVPAGQSSLLSWQIRIPEGLDVVATQVVAKAGEFSDAEENIVPVLKNRMLVTESKPLAIRGNETKTLVFDKLLNNSSTTLRHQKLTLEFSSNPAWYAVQALPYLMEFPHECTEQIFSRYYANALATHIANSSPKTRKVFEQWRNQAVNETLARQSLLSNLEKNQELKSVLLEETPWVLNARDESERKRRVGMLFDLNRMANELDKAHRQLHERQNNDGSFSWFPGMQRSRYITQLIITGMGHLQKLGVSAASGNPEISQMVVQALPYLDSELQQDLERTKRYAKNLDDNHLGPMQIQYLYMRSFFTDQQVSRGAQEAFDYYFKQAKQYWTEQSPYMQGMLALVFHRYDEQTTAREILASLKERAVYNQELGMYWKQPAGFYWYQAPIEQQALLIEAFEEVEQDTRSVEEMKIWLLKNKQTNDWKSTRATVAACNALLSSGTDWLESEALVDISLGGERIDPYQRADARVEAGTGYFKTAWLKDEIKPEMGRITLSKKDPGIAWGALYWQYFEQLDKITFAETPLSIRKQLYVEQNTPQGPQLRAISPEVPIHTGDKVVVRIELRVDRDMEYVHLKDMRAAAFEPLNVLSQYKYQAGLGYYESTRDAATHFFFERLPKGTHVFEYPLRATQQGEFSNGISSIQCMYAPEFSSHSEGMRVRVE